MRLLFAEQSIQKWMKSSLGRELTDKQFKVLATTISQGVRDGISSMVPEAVQAWAEEAFPELFPEEENVQQSSREVPPREPQQELQSLDEIKAVVDKYAATGHWDRVAVGYARPWANGGIGSRPNFILLAQAIKDFRATGQRLRVSDICDIVYALASKGVFERIPQTVVVEKPVPPPPPPTPQELVRENAKREYAVDRLLNDRSTSPIRGAKEQPKQLVPRPVLTEEQRQAKEAANRETDAIIAEAQRRISVFTGPSHARTYSGRAELTSIFTAAMDEGVGAKDVLARVEQAIDRLAGNSSIR